MTRSYTFTSESVTEGHPDKMADQISDAVLDAILASDPFGRVACECLLTTGLVAVAGEISTDTYVDIPKLVRKTVCDIGYNRESFGFDGNTCGVIVSIDEQSPDIGQGVDTAYEIRTGRSGEDLLNAQGAGDQGMMFGFACDETPDLMPLPIWLAHRLAQRMSEVRKAGVLPYLRPDGKTQVTFEYQDGRPVALRTVLISTQHQPGLDIETLLKPDLNEHVIHPMLPPEFAGDSYRVLANPTGRFELGGPHADTGLTGRKIIVDTYGGAARHGGGSFSGKDPSKVDRSAAYASRWVAKHVVEAGALALTLPAADGPEDDGPRVVRVLPDVAAIDRPFDYLVPERLEEAVGVGTRVRAVLHNRRVGGWVVADRVAPPEGVRLRPLSSVSGMGPAPELVELARWAAWRWAGPMATFLQTASPPRIVRQLPPRPGRATLPSAWPPDDLAQEALARPRSVLRLPPPADPLPLVAAALARARERDGSALVLAPSHAGAERLSARLRWAGVDVALLPGEWPLAAAGATAVVGTRAGAWGPVTGLSAVVVLDGHDEAYHEERAPTWVAWVVAAERAQRAGAPCVIASPCPTLELRSE